MTHWQLRKISEPKKEEVDSVNITEKFRNFQKKTGKIHSKPSLLQSRLKKGAISTFISSSPFLHSSKVFFRYNIKPKRSDTRVIAQGDKPRREGRNSEREKKDVTAVEAVQRSGSSVGGVKITPGMILNKPGGIEDEDLREDKRRKDEKSDVFLGRDLQGGMSHLRPFSRQRKVRGATRRHYTMADRSPKFQFTPIDQTVSHGAPVSLKCSATGFPLPLISWTRDGEPLVPNLRTHLGSFRHQDQIISFVNMSDVTPREGGIFRCSAHNSAGVITSASRLNVYGSPFIRPLKNLSVVVGEDAVLWCPVGGFPLPSLSWRHQEQSLPTSLRHEILGNNTLIIRNTMVEDLGRYTCIARGRGGQHTTADTFLTIINPPVIEVFGFSPPLEEGKRTQLNCMVASGDLPITMQWLKNGHHLTHDLDMEHKQISDYSVVLLFKRLDERHSGRYTCLAANSAGAANRSVDLNVEVPPKWILSPSGVNVSVGGTVHFGCMARGVPEPVITWRRSSGADSRVFQNVLPDGQRVTITKNGTLSIMAASKRDAANYLCEASNGVGSPLSKIAKLTVSAGPEITSVGSRLVAHAGHSMKLDCEAKGDAPMTLKWRKDQRLIAETKRISVRKFTANEARVGSSVTFTNILPSDAGQYECEAVNPHGRDSEIFNLAVLEPPSAPTSVKVSHIYSRSAKLSWVTSQPVSVTIQLKGSESSWSDGGRNISVKRRSLSHVLTSLTPFTKYSLRLISQNELGVSIPSNSVHFVTLEEAPSGAPQNIRVTSTEPGSLQIEWNPPALTSIHGQIRGYVIAIRQQNLRGDFHFISRPVMHYDSELSGEEYVVRNLSPNTLYEVALMVFNRAGTGPMSTPRIVQATMYEAPGCPPSGVSCKADISGLRVGWEPPLLSCVNAPITGYSILATPTRKSDKEELYTSTKEVLTTNLEKNIGGLPSSSNISIVLRAYNSQGFSTPSKNIFCRTFDSAPSAPLDLVVLSPEPGAFVAAWLPPSSDHGVILRYTLYYEDNDKVKHLLISNTGADSSWKKVTGFHNRQRITVWVTASSAGGEGPPTRKVVVNLMGSLTSPSAIYGPFAISSQSLWRVPQNTAVTLRCRGIGDPVPSISWLKEARILKDGPRHQILPGGDLHLIPDLSANYTCRSTTSLGEDDLKFQIMVLNPPSFPVLRVNEVDRTYLNMSIDCLDDGGAPVLGFKIFQRYQSNEWYEKSVAKTSSFGPTHFLLRDLPCGSDIHLYATAWNSQGLSPSSEVLVVPTRGSIPLKPQPSTMVEVNSTCVTLRLYTWPENDCQIQHWKVQGKHENANEWRLIFPEVGRELRDIAFCDLQRTEPYLLNIIAYSDAGLTKVTYKIFLHNVYSEWKTSEYVQEVLLESETLMNQWLDAHIIAGILSAFLLTAAVVICICVIVKRKERCTNTPKEEAKRLSHQYGNAADYRLYSPLPSKKVKPSLGSPDPQRRRSSPSLVGYRLPEEEGVTGGEIYPYATFSAGSVDDTLQYGISLHTHSPTSRECYEGAQRREDIYTGRKDRAFTQFKDSDVDVSYSPSKRMVSDRPKKPRSTSRSYEGEIISNDIERPSGETATIRVTERNARPKNNRPTSRFKGKMAPIPGGNRRSELGSPTHQDYPRPVPIQTLYGGQVRGGGRGTKDSTMGRLVRNESEGLSSSRKGCVTNSATSRASAPINPPSAFSDSSEAECDREASE